MSKNMKDLLVVGKLGYHEKTIVEPLISELSKDFNVDRIGESLDFFIPSKYGEMYSNYSKSIIDFKELEKYSVVLFVDFWNPLVPMYQMAKHFFNPDCKLVGICHGSYYIEGDVACDVKGAEEYENYLNQYYDLIIVPRQFLIELMGSRKNMKLCPFPMDIALSGSPEFKYKRRVIYAHRYDYDKGNDLFESFVKYCQNYASEDIEFIVIGNCSEEQVSHMQDLGIDYRGYMTFEQQKELCKEGGYAWASVRSELMAYAVWHLVSFGLTPLLNDHPAYENFPNRFKYGYNSDALAIIEDSRVMTISEWERLKKTEEGNSSKISKMIKDLVYV